MAVGSSTIKMRAIFNEINGTSHASNATITDCKMSEFRTDSNEYTAGTYSGGTPDVKATPDRISEWFGYTHTQDFDDATYYVRNTTSTNVNTQKAAFCVARTAF